MGGLFFWKMTGAGNDFVVLDGRTGLPAPPETLARSLCPRRSAVGADGLLVVAAVHGGQVRVDYRNADGSPAGFCGNGARCVARFAADQGLAPSPLEVVFPALTVRADVAGDYVALEGPRPRRLPDDVRVRLGDGAELHGQRIAAGVEHVVFADRRPALSLPELARRLFRERPDLEGCVNITVVRVATDDQLFVRTFERGVGETLACGSGAWAAAAFAAGAPGAEYSGTVIPPSGAPLSVRLEPGDGPAHLAGEARLVYVGEVAPETLAGRC